MLSTDVLILGGGIAGVAAALAARSRGAGVHLVRHGPGATAMASGGWVGSPPAPVLDALAAAGLPLEPCTARLPHPEGRLLHADLAPDSHARAAIEVGAELAIVCGIAGLPSFRPTALARLWSHAADLPRHALEPVTLGLPGTPPAGWSPVSLAAAVERDPQLLAGPLARAAREHGAARAFLPAVVGLGDHARVLAEVRRTAGVAVGEALGVAPSVPGWRLEQALVRALSLAGVTVVTGRVKQPTSARRPVTEVTARTPQGDVGIRPGALVLATGKFIGGGITANTPFGEVALGSDVVADRFGRQFRDATESLALTDAARRQPQPLLGLGVRSNEDGQLLTEQGDVGAANVFLAGSVRAGTETALLGLGHAAADGWAAGLRAADFASTRTT
jgi:glycerol-3-phosphate dehydrogenase subunit B